MLIKSIIILVFLIDQSPHNPTLAFTCGRPSRFVDTSDNPRFSEIEHTLSDRAALLKLAPIAKTPNQTILRLWLQYKSLTLVEIKLGRTLEASKIDINADTKTKNPNYRLSSVTPKSGWIIFLAKINRSGILRLTPKSSIHGQSTASHTTEATFEIVNAGHYSFHNCVDLYADQFKDQTILTLRAFTKIIDQELR